MARSRKKLTSDGEALSSLDSEWFSKQYPHFMDLIGDYAGKELFVIDGDSLVQRVLSDPLLALAKPEGLL